MGNVRRPRHGSMQYWPRVRARRSYPRVRSWVSAKEAKLLGFAGYKIGMTHLLLTDNRPNSKTKGQDISCPATVVECPPLKMVSIRFYKRDAYGSRVATEVFTNKVDKDLQRTLPVPKKDTTQKLSQINPKDYDTVTVLLHTQPRLTALGKKKPEIFEMALGGSVEEKFAYAKENLGKEVKVEDILKEGQQVDIHAVTKGKGFQGPVKRFGVTLRSHKSEKTKRGPGSLGAWCGQGHIMYRVAHAGKMGYHTRTEYNKWLLKITNDSSKINPSGGFMRLGNVKSSYVLVKGSIPGPSKRLIRFTAPIRENKGIPKDAPAIQYISVESHQ
ncbi:50S ribosomal protein L3 [Candidatus Woesearchaeota archaeon]|nr:50S ribosomal protein L3 [Candidatus Woesearchaeota archaeon]